MKRALLVAVANASVAFAAHGVPFWGAKSSMPADTDPEKLEPGLSIVISAADRRAIVLRNGMEIGRARVDIDELARPFGTHALVMLEGAGEGKSPIDPRTPAHRWIAVGLPGHAGKTEQPALDIARIHLPPGFASALYAALAPGATLLVTDAPVLEETTGVPHGIVNADPA